MADWKNKQKKTTTKRGQCCSRSAFGKVRFLGHKIHNQDFTPTNAHGNNIVNYLGPFAAIPEGFLDPLPPYWLFSDICKRKQQRV